jgi:hypothetical protein
MFTVASLLVPYLMFPGSLLCAMIGEAMSGYAGYLAAVLNGVFYGAILWLVFVVISRRLETEK